MFPEYLTGKIYFFLFLFYQDSLPFDRHFILLFPFSLSTIWYELQARDWPIINQPVEATIWQVGSGEGIKKVLAEISLGKEVTVS